MTRPSRSSILLRIALVAPAAYVGWWLGHGEPWRYGIRPTGDVAAKLVVLTLAIGPLARLFPGFAWTGWLLKRRRIFGLAAFGYVLFHLAVFGLSIGRLDWIIQGMAFASMWTGWIAFALLLVNASISNGTAIARLGRWWKRLQRLAYAAAALTLAHWLLLSPSPWEAAAHAAPLALLWAWIGLNHLFREATPRILRRR